MNEADSRIVAALTPFSATEIGGYAYDSERPDRRLVLEFLVDDAPAALCRADLFDANLARQGQGDGCYAFLFSLPAGALEGARRLEIRLANGAAPLASLHAPFAVADAESGSDGEVRWFGGLRLNGCLGVAGSGEAGVRALVEGKVVAQASPNSWVNIGEGAQTRSRRAFDLFLPETFADGCAHHARVVDQDGRDLPGSPVFFVAFPDGLAQALQKCADLDSHRLRAEFFDRLMPQSLPFTEIGDWKRRFALPAPAAGETAPIVVVLIGEDGAEASFETLEAQEGCDWLATIMETPGGAARFDAAALAEFLTREAGASEVVVFALGGASFAPSALALLAAALKKFTAAPWAYADFTLTGADGGEWPAALSAFDYERLLEQGAGALFFAARRDYLDAALAAGADSLFRVCNYAFDRRRARGPRQSVPLADVPVHVPGFLARLPRFDAKAMTPALAVAAKAHFDARRMPTRIESAGGFSFPRIRAARTPAPGKVSILIPTRDRVDLLKPCIDSLFATVDLAFHELIVLDNDSADPETLSYFEQVSARGVRVFRVGGSFNFARIVNAGAAVASGQYLLLLNNDVEALRKGWLEEMLGRIAEPDVGAVGAHLLWPSGVVQHGGVVLGPRLAAAHAFNDRMDGDPGYADLLLVAHECSAVTAACLLTEKALFDSLGGFDALNFPVNFNDVDYCLKLRALGLRVVQTPHAKLLHRESASRGKDEALDKSQRTQRELRNLRTAWGDALVADPSYSPLLSLDPIPYSALAWPPRPAKPRQPGFPQKRSVPPGF
jgi:GT2 family glycosyltransferase